MAPVNPDEMRVLLADQENRILRLIKAEVQPLKDQAQRIEVQVVATNGRVTHLEQWRIAIDARAQERAIAVKEAADLVAEQAAKAALTLQSHESSRKWLLARSTLLIGAVGITTPFISSMLHHFGVL